MCCDSLRIITAAKRRGLYSAMRTWRAIFLQSSFCLRSTVATTLCRVMPISSAASSPTGILADDPEPEPAVIAAEAEEEEEEEEEEEDDPAEDLDGTSADDDDDDNDDILDLRTLFFTWAEHQSRETLVGS